MTDHPLTEEAVAERLDADARLSRWKNWTASGRAAIVSAFRAAFDAGREHERANPTDGRPWEPLNGRPLYVGDEVRRDYGGVTTIAVVGRVDDEGDPWAAEGALIGDLSIGTWYVRRPARELPTEFGAAIVPAEGHETITATDPEAGTVWRTREAARISSKHWTGVWRDEDGTFSSVIPAGWIDADTWQEDSA